MRPVTVTSGRHPYEVAVHASAVVCGVALAVIGAVPHSAAAAMRAPVQVLWIGLLIAAGVAQLVGAYWRGRVETALRIELAGVLLLAGGTTMYAVALFAGSGLQATAAGAFLTGISVGSWWRAAQIVRDLRRVVRADQIAAVQLLVEGEHR